jgi:hypothetical protein
MDFTTVDEYLKKLYFAQPYKDLTPEMQDSIVFTAQEFLLNYYKVEVLTPKVVSYQVLYMLEGEDEEYSKLKRHGAVKLSTKGTSVEFGTKHNIAPDVIAILGEPPEKEDESKPQYKAAIARIY